MDTGNRDTWPTFQKQKRERKRKKEITRIEDYIILGKWSRDISSLCSSKLVKNGVGSIRTYKRLSVCRENKVRSRYELCVNVLKMIKEP